MKRFLVVLSVVLGFCVADVPLLLRPRQSRSPNDAASCQGQRTRRSGLSTRDDPSLTVHERHDSPCRSMAV
jgi:hypothetical protein